MGHEREKHLEMSKSEISKMEGFGPKDSLLRSSAGEAIGLDKPHPSLSAMFNTA